MEKSGNFIIEIWYTPCFIIFFVELIRKSKYFLVSVVPICITQTKDFDTCCSDLSLKMTVGPHPSMYYHSNTKEKKI
jgi:hypothetical protein